MSEENKKEVASRWGSLISVWGKIIGALIFFIITAGGTWYQIETNASDNTRQDEQFKQIMITISKELDVQSDRENKRNKRTLDDIDELHTHDDEHNKGFLELIKEVWYLKGKLDEQDKH